MDLIIVIPFVLIVTIVFFLLGFSIGKKYRIVRINNLEKHSNDFEFEMSPKIDDESSKKLTEMTNENKKNLSLLENIRKDIKVISTIINFPIEDLEGIKNYFERISNERKIIETQIVNLFSIDQQIVSSILDTNNDYKGISLNLMTNYALFQRSKYLWLVSRLYGDNKLTASMVHNMSVLLAALDLNETLDEMKSRDVIPLLSDDTSDIRRSIDKEGEEYFKRALINIKESSNLDVKIVGQYYLDSIRSVN